MSEEKKNSLENLEERLDDEQSSISQIGFDDLLSIVLLNLKWFAVSVVICLLIAGAYLYWAKPSVTVTGRMQLQVSEKGGLSSSLAAISSSIPFGLGGKLGGSASGDVEMEIMKSTLMVRDVVCDLDLHTEYRLSKWGRSRLLYRDQPIQVSLDKAHLEWFDKELPLTVHKIELDVQKDAQGYTVEGTLIENKEETDLPSQTFAKLPATIKTAVGTLTISENQFLTPKQQSRYVDGYTLKVSIVPPVVAANTFLKNLEVDPSSKTVTTILEITLKDENIMRGIAFIDKLVEVYNRRANEDKNERLMKTDAFVNERLAKVDAELGSSDAAWENYKTKFKVTDPKVDAQETMSMKSGYETKLVELGAQLQIVDYLSDYVNNPANRYAMIPSNIGLDKGSSISSVTEKYNETVLERNRLLKSVSEQSPQVQLLSKTLDGMYPSVQAALRQARQAVNLQRQAVEREYNRYQGRAGNTPSVERALTDIGRQREIKQAVYLVMLQKREENAMELTNSVEKAKLIDQTQADPASVSPKIKMVLMGALFLGVLIPFGILYLIWMFGSSFVIRQDVESLTSLPIIGQIPPGDDAEAVRNLRTNLLQRLKPDQKVILFASDADGDGKTYLAKQLDDSLKAIGKKSLYMNLDLRSQSSVKGHPSDYFASEDFAAQIQQAKSANDYVILDSPSVSKYYDAYQIAQFADATCYVLKPGTTSKTTITSLDKTTRLPHVNLIINAKNMSKKKFRHLYKSCSLLLLFALMLTSCGSTKKVPYFQNRERVDLALSKGLFDARIMPKDILQIRVFSVTPEASEPFNLMKGNSTSSSTRATDESSVYNYLVDNEGNIVFPVIGTIHLGGMTKNEAEAFIKSKIEPYLAAAENPIVHVRMVNYKYTVIGEVNKPGMFTTKNEKINVIEALAQAGDLTLFGQRDKVFLIRENAEGQKEYHQLDISDAGIVSSPYYYLQQNDIVYVEPHKSKARQTFFSTASSMWLTLTSMLMSVTTFIIALSK